MRQRNSVKKDSEPSSKQISWPTWLVALLAASLFSTCLSITCYIILHLSSNQSTFLSSENQPTEMTGGKIEEGRWGKILTIPISIEPPADFLDNNISPDLSSWHFDEITLPDLESFLLGSGLAQTVVNAMLAHATHLPDIKGFAIPVSADLLEALSPITRSTIYLRLSDVSMNAQQYTAFRYCSDSVSNWLIAPLVSSELRARIEKYIYKKGCYMFFADLPLVLPHVKPDEIINLLKALNRQSSYLMKVMLSPNEDIERLTQYWEQGHRAKDIRPIIESLTRLSSPSTMDVVHFLPAFARRRLFTFPSPYEWQTHPTRDCHWTALNFFNEVPDDLYADATAVGHAIDNEYREVLGTPLLGDLVLYVRKNGTIFHSANYLAADYIYTKSGSTPKWPWLISKVDEFKDFYPKPDPIKILYFRHRDR